MNVAELVTLTADKVIDARGTACPGPLLEAKKGIGAVKVGHEFLGLIEADGHDRLFVLRKK